jgi:hypothetical protein
MATEKLGIVIDATVKGKREVEGLNKELGGMQKASFRARDALGRWRLAPGLLRWCHCCGIGAAAQKAWQYIGRGAELRSGARAVRQFVGIY